MIVELSGRFITAPAPYEYSFVPEGEQELKEGTSRKAYIHQVDGEKPTIVSFDDDQADAYDELRRLPFGTAVSMLVEASRKNAAKFKGDLRSQPSAVNAA